MVSAPFQAPAVPARLRYGRVPRGWKRRPARMRRLRRRPDADRGQGGPGARDRGRGPRAGLRRSPLVYAGRKTPSSPSDRTVVVTHHAPSHRSIVREFHGAAENGAFVSDLEHVMHRYQPDLRIHGHVHSSHDYRLGRTRVLCNPKGYGPYAKGMTQENRRFDPKLVVTL